MVSRKHLIKLCGKCGNDRVYNDYHRLLTYVRDVLLKIHLNTIKIKEIKKTARPKVHQKNTKNFQKAHTEQIEEPNKKVEDLKLAMETVILKNGIDIY